MSTKYLKRTAAFYLNSDGFSIHTIELSVQYTERGWRALKDKLYKELEKRKRDDDVWLYPAGKQQKRYQDNYICTRFAKSGVRITLEHNINKDGNDNYFVRMVINPRKLIDPHSSYLGILKPTEDAVEEISEAFHKLMEGTPFFDRLEDYLLTRLDLCTNIHCDNKKIFKELIRVSQRLPTPPKFERKYYKDKDKEREKLYNKHYICFACKSYELVMYDKTYQMEGENLLLSYEKLPKGVLRYEVRLQRSKIRDIAKKYHVSAEETKEVLEFFVKNAMQLLIIPFYGYFPPVQYLREPELLKTIHESGYKDYIRHTMAELVRRIKKYGSTDEALDSLARPKDERKELLDRFYRLHISPIPMRKNFSSMTLPTPTCLLIESAQKGRVEVSYVRIK